MSYRSVHARPARAKAGLGVQFFCFWITFDIASLWNFYNWSNFKTKICDLPTLPNFWISFYIASSLEFLQLEQLLMSYRSVHGRFRSYFYETFARLTLALNISRKLVSDPLLGNQCRIMHRILTCFWHFSSLAAIFLSSNRVTLGF